MSQFKILKLDLFFYHNSKYDEKIIFQIKIMKGYKIKNINLLLYFFIDVKYDLSRQKKKKSAMSCSEKKKI